MIKPISFGSTYKAYITKNDVQNGIYSHSSLTDYLEDENIPYSQSFIDAKRTPTYSDPFKVDTSSQFIPGISDYAVSKYTIVAPDEKDSDIETILANRGIKYEKISSNRVLSPESISNRILPPEDGYVLAFINSEKLEKLIENQDSNFEHTKSDYDNYYKPKTDFVLKSGDEISPQTLYIKYLDDDSTPESLKEYVKRFGTDNLNSGSILISQQQRGVSTDINMYYGLKDLGFKNIPVYLDEDSFQNAQTLGLLE